MQEERELIPFVPRAPSGKELQKTLRLFGLERNDVSLSNAILCRPPGRSLKQFLARLGKANRNRKRDDGASVPTPMKCCWPRLEAEIASAPALLLLGATALTTVRDHGEIWLKDGIRETRGRGNKGLMRLRGFPVWVGLEDRRIPTVATIHPAFVLRKRRWTETLRSDVGKAIRHATGRLQWVEPQIVLDPTAEQLSNVLTSFRGKIVGLDVETAGKEPLESPLRCVGMGTTDLAVVAGFESVEDPPTKWRCPTVTSRRIIRDFLASGAVKALTGNNENIFDRLVMWREEMPLPDWHDCFDNCVAHHVTDPEMPHSLDFMQSRYTDAPKHKDVQDHIHGWDSDRQLHIYNALDCVASARKTGPLARQMHAEGLLNVYASDVELQRLCVGMHRAGVWIDQGERARHSVRLQAQIADAARRARDAAGREINLQSPVQLQEYLFRDLCLPPTKHVTKAGEPSTSKKAVYELMRYGSLPERVEAFLLALLDHRRATKFYGTYIRDLPIWPDGRVRSHFSPHTNIAGRINSSEPNVQNWPHLRLDTDSLRSVVAAAPGNVLVGADYAAIHLRLIAVVAGVSRWLEIFEKGTEDLHCFHGGIFFGKVASAIEKFERDFAKTLIYQLVYRGGALNAWQVIQQARNPATGKRPYAGIKLRDIREMRDRLIKQIPELSRWWDETLLERRRRGQLRTILLGRKHTFLDSYDSSEEEEEASQIINFPILGLEGDVMSGAVQRLMPKIGWPWYGELRGLGGPGIVHQNYDSILCEVKAENAERCKDILVNEMTTTLEYRGRSVNLLAEAKPGIAQRWSGV